MTSFLQSHSDNDRLICEAIGGLVAHFVPDAELTYVRSTDDRQPYLNRPLISKLGIELEANSKMPDVVLYAKEKNLLLLIDCITGQGYINARRRTYLSGLFERTTAGLAFLSAFPDREALRLQGTHIAWGSVLWFANTPSHMIHFDGARLLGPYDGHPTQC
ncbi:MAG: hypothetical protein HZB40_15270 [Rhodocyclales bacterium]|nr:hypothetical protein [Rhodocyclales bacterium]